MKQGKIYNKLILGALLLAIVCYMGFAVLSALHEPLTTVQAVEYEAGSGCRVLGYVVRDELQLTSQYAITVLERQEGEKVGVGQPVAAGYQTADAQERQAQIEALTEQLQQLEYASDLNVDPENINALETQILAELLLCAQLTAGGDLAAVAERSPQLRGLVLRGDAGETDLSALRSRISALQAQLQQLQTVSAADTAHILAPDTGYFSGVTDGYETVLTPERLSVMTAADLETLTPVPPSGQVFGRLIRGADWYFAAAVPTESTSDTEAGDQVEVTFTVFSEPLSMTVSHLGEDEGGTRLMVLTSSEYIQDVTLLREQTADVVFQSFAGLRVPKDALRLSEDGKPGVFVLESASAKWKEVHILADSGESYVVALNKDDTGNLWPGDEIIIEAGELYDGKVVALQ